jgi:hypothetical protein
MEPAVVIKIIHKTRKLILGDGAVFSSGIKTSLKQTVEIKKIRGGTREFLPCGLPKQTTQITQITGIFDTNW